MEAFTPSAGAKAVVATGLATPAVTAAVRSHADAFRRHVFELVCSLHSEASVPLAALAAACEFLRPVDYGDAVSERAAGGVCGYPLCAAPLPSPRLALPLGEAMAWDRAQRARAAGSGAGGARAEGEGLECYCSRWCWKCSAYLAAQLRDVAPAVRMGERAAAAATGSAPPGAVELVPPMAAARHLGVSKRQLAQAQTLAEQAQAQALERAQQAGALPLHAAAAAAQGVVKQRATAAMVRLQAEMSRLELSAAPGGGSGGVREKPAPMSGVGVECLAGGGRDWYDEEEEEEEEGEEGAGAGEGAGEEAAVKRRAAEDALLVEGYSLERLGRGGAPTRQVLARLAAAQKRAKASLLQAPAAAAGGGGGGAAQLAAQSLQAPPAAQGQGDEEALIDASQLHLARQAGLPAPLPEGARPKHITPSYLRPFPKAYHAPMTDFSRKKGDSDEEGEGGGGAPVAAWAAAAAAGGGGGRDTAASGARGQ